MKTAVVALVVLAIGTGCQGREADRQAVDTTIGGVDTLVTEREVEDTAIVRAETTVQADTAVKKRVVQDTTVTADTAVRKDTLQKTRPPRP